MKFKNLINWLKDSAIPFGKIMELILNLEVYFELNCELEPIIMPRRARLVARQIYSFAKG